MPIIGAAKTPTPLDGRSLVAAMLMQMLKKATWKRRQKKKVAHTPEIAGYTLYYQMQYVMNRANFKIKHTISLPLVMQWWLTCGSCPSLNLWLKLRILKNVMKPKNQRIQNWHLHME